jgi:hypothetical protein
MRKAAFVFVLLSLCSVALSAEEPKKDAKGANP